MVALEAKDTKRLSCHANRNLAVLPANTKADNAKLVSITTRKTARRFAKPASVMTDVPKLPHQQQPAHSDPKLPALPVPHQPVEFLQA